MLSNNLLAFALTLSLALIWLRLNDFAAQRGWVDSRLSRKIIHTGTGPIYVLCWLLFTQSASSRYLAAIVPLAITAQFVLVGLGVVRDEAAVKAMSRSGDRREILHGPLYYGIVFVALTLLYWLESPIGMVALIVMSGGDGLADIVGRRYGVHMLPWSKRKTWEGSLAMFGGGWIFASLVLAVYLASGVFEGRYIDYFPAIAVIAGK